MKSKVSAAILAIILGVISLSIPSFAQAGVEIGFSTFIRDSSQIQVPSLNLRLILDGIGITGEISFLRTTEKGEFELPDYSDNDSDGNTTETLLLSTTKFETTGLPGGATVELQFPQEKFTSMFFLGGMIGQLTQKVTFEGTTDPEGTMDYIDTRSLTAEFTRKTGIIEGRIGMGVIVQFAKQVIVDLRFGVRALSQDIENNFTLQADGFSFEAPAAKSTGSTQATFASVGVRLKL